MANSAGNDPEVTRSSTAFERRPGNVFVVPDDAWPPLADVSERPKIIAPVEFASADEYEPEQTEYGSLHRIRYVGDTDPWVGQCTFNDYATGKRGSRKAVIDSLKAHFESKHTPAAEAGTGATDV